MAYSKVILNGTTLMDVTNDTVDEDNLLSGETATKNNGLRTTGTVVVPTKTSDLTNDSGFITSAQAPVQSVNGQTGAVTVQATLVSGTNIKTVNNESLLGSGNIDIQGGGGSVNKLVLYMPNDHSNLYVDQAQTISLLEYYGYDYDTAHSGLSDTDIIWVQNRDGDKRYAVARWYVDPIDESFSITVVTGTTSPVIWNINIS